MVWYGGLRRLSDAPEDQNVSFPHSVDVLWCVENSYFWLLLRKIWLYKPPREKIFFLRFAQFLPNNFFRGDPGPNLLVKFIPCHVIGVYQLKKKIEIVFYAKCVTSSYFSVATTFFTFLTGQKWWKFIWVKSDFRLHWIVSADFTSKYTLKTFILSFKFGQFHLSSFNLEVFCVLVSVRPDNFSTQILQKNKQIWLQMWFKGFNFT